MDHVSIGRGQDTLYLVECALGGMGARTGLDGLSTTAFPSGVGAVSVETAEVAAPLVYHSKEFATDTGGAGEYRGGLAQRIEIGSRINEDMILSAAAFERLTSGPSGRQGGMSGAVGKVTITDGTSVTDKGIYKIPAGEHLVLQTPGGGGIGNPIKRNKDALLQDLKHGLISKDAARSIYHLTKNETEEI